MPPYGMQPDPSYNEFKKRRVLGPTKQYSSKNYRTPSGKIKIYSEQVARLGYASTLLWQELRQRLETN